MKLASRTAATLLLLVGVAGCDSIGEGSTVESLRIVVSPVDTFEQGVFVNVDTPDEKFRMYHCFCSNLAVLATFTDGTVANFSGRAKWSSNAPGVATVLDYFGTTDLCPLGQTTAGLVIPNGIGEATITASFGGITDTLKIEVADATLNADGSPAVYELIAAPPAAPDASAVAVGASLGLRVNGTIDGRTRLLNRSVMDWSFDNTDDPDGEIALLDVIGFVRAFDRSGSAPRIAHARFGTCPTTDPVPTKLINIGDVVPPLALEREPVADDGMLATSSDELLKVTANLDFGNGTTDSQLISSVSSVSFTDTCTIVDHDPADTTGTTCRTQTGQTCQSSPVTPHCGATVPTSCALTMTPCRTETSPIITTGRNRIFSLGDNGSPTNITATFPFLLGTDTTLAAEVPAGSAGDEITITVDSFVGYPTTFPWYGVIENGTGNREDVRVTAVDGTALTVVRGISGTPANLHASGSGFEQRSYTSDPNTPLVIRGKEGTLKVVAVDPPGMLPPLGTIQLTAQGTFEDTSAIQRTQRVTRLTTINTGSPTVTWFTDGSGVAVVGSNNGQLLSTSPCGGRVSVRARASTSTDSTTASFNSTVTTDDEACENTDPLCDQVEVCVARQNPLPLGFVCEDPETICP